MLNFKMLGLNWYPKFFQIQIDVNFRMLGLKMIFTQSFYYVFEKGVTESDSQNESEDYDLARHSIIW